MLKALFLKLFKLMMAVALIIPLVSEIQAPIYAEENNPAKISDDSTMNSWTDLFGTPDNITTKYSGRVWTDKSVFTNGTAFANTKLAASISDSNAGITVGKNSFLVALSALASTSAVSGVSNAPTDTMIVLDLSSSMYIVNQVNNASTVQAMVNAVNTSIAKLFSLNPDNRVGITIYYGKEDLAQSLSSHAMVLLPLDRYSHADNQYISITKTGSALKSIQVNSDVKNSAGSATTQNKLEVKSVAGTYAQLGLLHALNEFTDASTKTAGGVDRTPIIIFMSDGKPTAATSKFTEIGNAEWGNNQERTRQPNESDFVTQLTAAYVKEKTDQHYGPKTPLFYSLSLGTTTSLDIMDPANQSNSTIDGYWNNLVNNSSVSFDVTTYVGSWGPNTVTTTRTVNKTDNFPTNVNQKNYVDKAFTATTADFLDDEFEKIVDTIDLQSSYYPTLVKKDVNLDGYVSFVDKIGEYMTVTDIKGILIGGRLYSGACLSKNFKVGENGGNLGTTADPKPLGDELVWAVQARLGIDNADKARELLNAAYTYGQLCYTSDTEFSKYIGWYAGANDQYLGFWHENTTADAPAGAAYIIKSYGYLGETDTAHGVSDSDMMYATVQVRKNISTGEETVAFAVPAALIPTIEYNIELNIDGDLTGLSANYAEPIRLLYEVSLKEGINELTISDSNVVNPDYVSANTKDGEVYFYSNQYDKNNQTGYGKVNTYSYFSPSRQNEEYYFNEDSLIYADQSGTKYNGTTQPDGNYYVKHIYYEKNGSSLSTKSEYRTVSAQVLDVTKANTDGTWFIPDGTVRLSLSGEQANKNPNKTETLTMVSQRFVDIHNYNVSDSTHRFVVGSTLGNNGKLPIRPETGLKIEKTVGEENKTAGAPTSFNFIIKADDGSEAGTYKTIKISADGTETAGEITFNGGEASISLGDQELMYIKGMTAGKVFTIKEEETEYYVSTPSSAQITLESNKIKEAEFVNNAKGTGNLTISKTIEHELGSSQSMFNGEFTIKVKLSGIGVNGKEFKAKNVDGIETTVTVDSTGNVMFGSDSFIKLKHNQQFEILGLPEGTTATVIEELSAADLGFTVSYRDNGDSGDGVVTIVKNATESVEVVNSYIPEKVYPVNISVSAHKNLNDGSGNAVADWDSKEFTFKLQQFDKLSNQWNIIDEVKINQNTPDHKAAFNLSAVSFDKAGSYAFQIFEVIPDSKVNGLAYDTTYHTFHVNVTDSNWDGKLEISSVESDHTDNRFAQDQSGNWVVSVDFTNVQHSTAPASASINIQKKLDNQSQSDKVLLNGYNFKLYTDEACSTEAQIGTGSANPDHNGIANIVYSSTDIAGEGKIDLLFDKAGTYQFYVKEVPGSVLGLSYSGKVVPVSIIVSPDNTGTRLNAVVSFTEDSEDTDEDGLSEIVFINTYQTEPAVLSLDVEKKITGRALIDQEFQFKLEYVSGEDIRNKDADNNLIDITARNNPDGTLTFSQELKFTKVGTSHYKLYETSEDGNGVVTDKTVYNLYITVTDTQSDSDGCGKSHLSATYTVSEVPGNKIVFENTYTVSEGELSLTIKKELDGKDLLGNEFTFDLYAADVNGNIIGTDPIDSANNNELGEVKFNKIPLIETGTLHYVIKERIPESAVQNVYDRIEFDASTYFVTLDVKDKGTGNYVADETILKNGSSADSIIFKNNYTPLSLPIKINGLKRFVGTKPLNAGDFTFELYKADSEWKYEGVTPVSISNSQDGTFEFTDEIHSRGEYHYVVKETVPSGAVDNILNGITYDDNYYFVRVTVDYDSRNGVLSESKREIFNSTGAIVEQTTLEFINSYDIIGDKEIIIQGTKNLTGRTLKDGEFTFELYNQTTQITETTKNVDGKFSFTLNYTDADLDKEYVYILRESAGSLENITYDSAVYILTVKVEGNSQGGIRTILKISKNGELIDMEDIVFNNKYSKKPEPTPTPNIPTPTPTPGSPKTGDNSNLGLWILLMTVSGLAGLLLVLKTKRVN